MVQVLLYGAYESEKGQREVEKLAKRSATTSGSSSRSFEEGRVGERGKDEWRTRLHDDACVFLNRPGFERDRGCALHLHAMNTGKPSRHQADGLLAASLRAVDRAGGRLRTSVLTESGRAVGVKVARVRVVVHGAKERSPVASPSQARWNPSCADARRAVYEELASTWTCGSLQDRHPCAFPRSQVSLGRTRVRRPDRRRRLVGDLEAERAISGGIAGLDATMARADPAWGGTSDTISHLADIARWRSTPPSAVRTRSTRSRNGPASGGRHLPGGVARPPSLRPRGRGVVGSRVGGPSAGAGRLAPDARLPWGSGCRTRRRHRRLMETWRTARRAGRGRHRGRRHDASRTSVAGDPALRTRYSVAGQEPRLPRSGSS